MSILDPFQSGEKLRQKWGEYLPPPAQLRVHVFTSAVQHVRENMSVQQSNQVRSQVEAGQIVDDTLNFTYVNEEPVQNPKIVQEAIKNVENADYLALAYENLEKARLGEQNAG